MNVSLTPELEELVADKVQTGMYASASEVVREALRLLNDRDEVRATRLQELRRRIQVGLDQYECGDVVDGGPAAFESAEQRARAVIASRPSAVAES